MSYCIACKCAFPNDEWVPEHQCVGGWRDPKDQAAALDVIARLTAENARMREALERLRDCDWIITLPDRMDAVRAIARRALADADTGEKEKT